ncbi:MAG: WhiB family transcriptional regulator [Microthrixaceae bacterium]
MDRSWEHRSACKGIDPVIFYPATDEDAETAKAVCAVCPVQVDCLEYAIANREHEGIWGGHTEKERQRIIRRRRRERAMKKAAQVNSSSVTAVADSASGDQPGVLSATATR